MRKRRKPVNWFLVSVLLVLIAIVVYIDRVVVPSVPPPFVSSPTATRDPESYVTEAEGLSNQGKFLQAIDTYNQAIRIKPSDPSLYIALAHVQVYAGKYDDALTNAENALLLNPDNSMAQAMRGWAETQKAAQAQTPDFTSAETSIKRALQLDPNNGVAHAYYAFLLGDMFQFNTGPYTDPLKTAIEESKVAISLAPNNLEARWARGFILYITANYEQAVPEYQAAINLNGNIPALHLDLGVIYVDLSLVDDAIHEYTLANTLNPSDPTPWLYSSRALARNGQFSKAAQYAEQAVKVDGVNPYLRGNWAYMLYKSGNFSDAAVQFSLAVNGGKSEDGQDVPPITPNEDDAWIPQYYYTYDLLLARPEVGRCADALPLAQFILSKFPNNEYAVYNAKYAQGLCQVSLGTPAPVPTATPKITPTP